MKPLRVIGLNSGTSMDGIDAALFKIKPKREAQSNVNAYVPQLDVELIDGIAEPFESNFRGKLHKLIGTGAAKLEDLCLLNAALGELFAQAAMKLRGRNQNQVDLIGSHGQTIWHAPIPKPFWSMRCAATLQLGEPAIIALKTKLPVIADFRTADLAAGGQGAPLVCFADAVLFGQDRVSTGILNIGGIANITIIDDHGEVLWAYDTGPGNILIDYCVRRLFHMDYDKDGKIGASGTINEAWLDELLTHPYFRKLPPKTTGRELYSDHYAEMLLAEAKSSGLSASDCIATITALTAKSIASSYQKFVLPQLNIERLILSGGGTNNLFLAKLLSKFWPHAISVTRHEEYGVPAQYKEAMLFALLAYTTFFHVPNNIPRCTGAKRRVCLGKLVDP